MKFLLVDQCRGSEFIRTLVNKHYIIVTKQELDATPVYVIDRFNNVKYFSETNGWSTIDCKNVEGSWKANIKSTVIYSTIEYDEKSSNRTLIVEAVDTNGFGNFSYKSSVRYEYFSISDPFIQDYVLNLNGEVEYRVPFKINNQWRTSEFPYMKSMIVLNDSHELLSYLVNTLDIKIITLPTSSLKHILPKKLR